MKRFLVDDRNNIRDARTRKIVGKHYPVKINKTRYTEVQQKYLNTKNTKPNKD